MRSTHPRQPAHPCWQCSRSALKAVNAGAGQERKRRRAAAARTQDRQSSVGGHARRAAKQRHRAAQVLTLAPSRGAEAGIPAASCALPAPPMHNMTGVVRMCACVHVRARKTKGCVMGRKILPSLQTGAVNCLRTPPASEPSTIYPGRSSPVAMIRPASRSM